MNRYEYKGNIRKGRCSKAARQAFKDIRADKDCYRMDYGIAEIPIVLREEMVIIEDY